MLQRHTMQLGDGVPEWVHLLPVGTFRAGDGRGPFRLADAAAVIAASMGDARLPIDVNHSTDLAAPQGLPAPAVGWIVEMQARPDGIWGRVEWNDEGKELLATRAYRSISPVFTTDKSSGVIRAILRASLTNNPALGQLTHLNSLEQSRMDLIQQIRAALGLSETASEAELVAAASAARGAVTAHAAQLRRIAEAAGLDVTLAHDGLVAGVGALRGGTAAVTTLTTQVAALQTELAALRDAGAADAAVRFVDGAIKGGKPINPTRDYWLAQHRANPAETEKVINALPSINAGGVQVQISAAGGAGGAGGADEATPEEVFTASKMGLDVKKLVAQRKKREAGAGDGRAA